MHRRTFPLLLLLVLGALLAPVAARAQEPELTLPRSSPLAEHGPLLLLSRWDGSAYRLATANGGRVTDVAGVPASPRPFDADIGPDAIGAPVIAYALGGDVFTVGLDGSLPPRPVAGVNTAADERAPSPWGGRLAFVRGSRAYVKRLYSSRPSVRLAGLPSRRCIAIDRPVCRRIEKASIESLEFAGRHVAQVWTYRVDGGPGFRQNEVRLVGADGRGSRQLRFMTSGLGGQTLLRPSIADGYVAWFQTCHGDPEGCRASGGAYRYRIADGTYARARDATQLGGWSWDGTKAWRSSAAESLGCLEHDGTIPDGTCRVHREAVAWRAMKAPKPVR